MKNHNPTLGIHGFSYSDLYDSSRLKDLLDAFDASVERHDPQLHGEFQSYRLNQGAGLSPEAISGLLVRMGPYVGQFVARIFDVTGQHQAQGAKIRDEMDNIFVYKNEIVDKLASVFKGEDTGAWDIPAVRYRFDLLIEAGFPEANRDDDPEHRVAQVGAALCLLRNHYKLIAKGRKRLPEQQLRQCRSGH